jgi:hypothetical protein
MVCRRSAGRKVGRPPRPLARPAIFSQKSPWASTSRAHRFIETHLSPNPIQGIRLAVADEKSPRKKKGVERAGEEDEGPRVGKAAVLLLQGGQAPGYRLHPLQGQRQAQAAPGILHHRRGRRLVPPPPASRQRLRLRRGVCGVSIALRFPPLFLPVPPIGVEGVPSLQRATDY